MEFHIPKSSDSPCFQDSFNFSPQELADIPCPDDISTMAEGSAQEDDTEILLPPGTSLDDFPDLSLPPGTSGGEFLELPLPPGTSGDEFPNPVPPKQKLLNTSNDNSPSLPPHKALGSTSGLLHSESENFNISPLNEKSQQQYKTDENLGDAPGKQAELLDESKISPSKMDSDEENQDFTIAKPKVLGKEQAKKRLMAFSLSKQPNTSVKKQNKAVTPAKNKEKPPNPNKGTNVQEQFRATISAIEEEKKKMFQNMPSYLLLEMSELAKSSHSSMSSSIQLLEKLKSENAELKNKDNSGKDGSNSNKSSDGKRKRSSQKSRSRSKEKKPERRSRSKRRSRSRSKTKRSHSRSRRRSYSRSRSRRSREKNYKTDNKNSRECQSVPKKRAFKDWNSFKAAGGVLEVSESEVPKNRSDESKFRRDKHKRSRSPNDRPDFKPIFNYLTKGANQMTSLQAKPADPGNSSPLFLEKTIKYTRTKPTLCWAENPSRATEFYMSRQMLLENSDEAAASVLLFIIENKKLTPLEGVHLSESPLTKTRLWYPREGFSLSTPLKMHNDLEAKNSHSLMKEANTDNLTPKECQAGDKEGSSIDKEDSERAKVSLERKISLVNDSYLSEEEEQIREAVLDDVKIKVDTHRVKVRSRWDSDYEGENSEKDSVTHKQEKRKETGGKMEIEKTAQAKDTLVDDFDVAPWHKDEHESIVKKKSTPSRNLKTLPTESPGLNTPDAVTGNLVSEYEEFLKMVSVDSSDDRSNQKDNVVLESKPKTDKPKMKKVEKLNEEDKKAQSAHVGVTDWDQESDHEEKSVTKKMQFTGTGSHDEFLILRKSESLDVTLEKHKKKPTKKKTEIPKSEKKKLMKKSSKAKKKKFNDSFSEDDSSSESYDSDSDSDSDESDSSGRKKKKKTSKAKKKSKKDSSSESDSDSDDGKTKKKKQMKKKSRRKKSSSSDDEEVETALLKQLDFKKQLIMKKIEEIDSVSDKGSKKKEKENRGKKKEKDSQEETDLEKYIKSGKKKKTEAKVEKDKKKSKYISKKGKTLGKRKKLKKSKSSSDSCSDSESSDESVKKKKTKKSGKRKRYSSESSDSEDKSKKFKSKSSKASKKKKARRDSSSSASDDSDDSSRERKMNKKGNKIKNDDEKLGKITELSFKENKENLLLDEPDAKSEEHSAWESKKVWKKPDGKNKKDKEEDDWETSSPAEESEEEHRTRESSWDEEFEAREVKPPPTEDNAGKTDKKQTPVLPEKELTVNTSADPYETNNQLSSETLKTSLSNFSFNENSFCSFGQELSRDFFLAERSYSNSGNISNGENFKSTLIEPRPFQSVSKDSVVNKPPDSEIYSPGYSDSDLSEAEMSKSEKPTSNAGSRMKEVYDPLNCDSDGSAENNEIELSSIPLPHVPDILPPGEAKHFENVAPASSSNSEGSVLKDLRRAETEISDSKLPCMTPPVKSSFTSSDFTLVSTCQSPFTEETNTPTKRQLMSVKGQQKLISKAASVFQDESDEENIEPVGTKEKVQENTQNETFVSLKEKKMDESKTKEEKQPRRDEKEKEKDYGKKRKKDGRDRSRERSNEREGRRRRSRSRESRDSNKTYNKKVSSPRRRRSRTPEINREKREIRSDSFEIEPLKGAIDSNELTDIVQPIPVLTGLEAPSSEGLWSRSLVPGCEFSHTTDAVVDHAESFDIYPPEETNFRNRNYDKDFADHDKLSADKSRDQRSKKDRRRSRSRSYSPRKKHRSKSPERRKSPRNRSPRRKSASPKRRDKSPFSPRRRSPKRKSPSRRYKTGRSPDKRKKSSSRSPRKRRGSPSRRSRSGSPRKYRSPKHREDSPGRNFGSRDRFSPRDDIRYNQSYPDGLQNRIPVIGAASDDIDMELGRHLPDSSVVESEMYSSFYEGEYPDEFGVSNYSEEVGVNNLITVKNHDIEKTNSPERLSLDQRIELELGVPMSGSQAQSDQYQMSNQVCPPFQEMNSGHFSNSYNCENSNISNDNFYQNQSVQMSTDFNGQYFNGHQQQPGYGSFQQYPNSQNSQNSVLQVGNIVEVVPTLQHAPPKTPQVMQVGNVLQVVPSQKSTAPVPSAHSYGPSDASPLVKTQKATAVVAPSSIVPTPNPEAVLNPLIKAIQLEREKRRKEKEKRKAEREARRKARQMRREAKLMSVNEKLKKSVQNEGLMLGQEVEDDELLDGLDVPSPPIPVEIITVSSVSALPPAGKGILITAGFMPKPPSEKKEVKFADGVCPGEGTSTSGGEDIASPPPKPKLPKEKRFKKKKTKVKKKVKVQIIRQIIQEDDDDEDDLSPPPPPPGDPPLVFFAKFPFAGDAQFPVYQTQTTTTTLTTVQYPSQTFE